MKTLLPVYLGAPLLVIVVQIYLLWFLVFSALRQIKLLPRTYSAADNPELFFGGTLLAGTFLIASGSFSSLFQAARFFIDSPSFLQKDMLLFFGQSFLVVTAAVLLYVGLQVMHLQIVWRKEGRVLTMPVSVLLSMLAGGLALALWFVVKEVMDGMTPRIISLQ